VANADPARRWSTIVPSGDLALRVCSALVLAPLAVAAAYVGDWPFALFWGLAGLGVLWEWTSLVMPADRQFVLLTGAAALALAFVFAATGRLVPAVIVLAMAMLATAVLAPPRQRGWVAGAIPYAGALGIASVLLRADREAGFAAIIFLFAVVWTTDVVAYVVGRAVGGPKLWPHVSPKKTWSGAVGGTVAAVLAAIVVARAFGYSGLLAIAVLAGALSICAQVGDLFESFLKRRFGAKDSGCIIPGHGGLMDRLDGYIAAAVVAAAIGFTRGGLAAPGRGLLVW
jgi:phosphatidate cytidylyltransferase